MPQAMKILDAKAAADKEWKKLETMLAWDLENQEQKGGCSGSTKRQKESPLCYTDGLMSPQKCGVGTKITKIPRQSGAPWRHCKRRLWSLRILHWTRLVCPDDCCKSSGCYCKISRLRRTSSRRSICIHLGKIGRCSQIAQSSEIRVSRCLDTSSTTQNGRNHGQAWKILCVPLERNLYGHPSAGLPWEKQFEEALLELGWEKNSELGMSVRSSETRLICVRKCGWHQDGWKGADYGSHVEEFDGKMWMTTPHHSLTVCIWDALNVNANRMKQFLNNKRRCLSPVFLLEQQKITGMEKPHAQTSAWYYDMEGHARKCVERYCELANKKVEQLYKVSSPCLDDHQSKQEELESVGELSEVCSQIVLKCLYLARIGRPAILWSVNKLARPVTKWTQACDRRLARRISYIHHTSDFRQYCHVGNTAQHCRLGFFRDSYFAGDLENSKSTSGGVLCIFGSRTFVPVNWMCKTQTSVSHSSTESEIISLDAGLRMDGLPALDL